jgi:hypothetical protein
VGTATGKRVSWDTGVGEWKRCQACDVSERVVCAV